MTQAVFNPLDPELLADPLPIYRELRQRDPVHRAPIGEGVWVLTRYDDIKRVVRDTEGLMQPPGFEGPPEFAGGPAERVYRGLMVLNDPPTHTRLRKLTEKALTRRAVEGLRPRIERVVDDAIDAAAERGEMDAVGELAFVVPLRVICGMLGIPESDRTMLLEWTPDFFRIFLPAANDEAGIAACHESCQHFIDYLTEGIEQRRRQPHDDIFSGLVAAEEEGDRLSRDELVATVLSLLTGGFDTTMGMIGAGVYTLAQQPEQFARLRQAPAELARPAVEEFLRWESPVGVTYRYLTEDLEIDGTRVPAGEAMWLVLASGNHDEARFEDPDRIDIDRPDNKHLAFGGARHFCIGNHLARMEGEVTFRKLAERLSELELAGEAPRRPNFQFRSFERLPVRFKMADGRRAR
jgi:cytochrome P450